MSEVVIHDPTPVDQQIELAKTLAPSGLLPEAFRGNPANIVYAIQYADALGLAPIHAIVGINPIKGKPTASADLMAAVVRRAGHKLRVTADDDQAVAELIRKDDPSFTYRAEWTMEKAKKAGLTSNNTYAKYASSMLRARAISEVVRMGASDAMFGLVYTPEDFGESSESVSVSPAKPSGPTTKVSRKKKEPEPEPEPEPATTQGQDELREAIWQDHTPPSQPQFRALYAVMGDDGVNTQDKSEIYAWLGQAVGREITSGNDLSKDEASRIIDQAQATATGQEPA